MSFSLEPAVVEDARTLARVFREAFSKDPIMMYLQPKVPYAVILEKDTVMYRDMIEEGDVYGKRLTKVVEKDTG